MKLKFEVASIEYTCKSISEFFGDGAMEEFQEYICEVYPSIILDEIKVRVGINPICPRYFKKIYLKSLYLFGILCEKGNMVLRKEK